MCVCNKLTFLLSSFQYLYFFLIIYKQVQFSGFWIMFKWPYLRLPSAQYIQTLLLGRKQTSIIPRDKSDFEGQALQLYTSLVATVP